MKNRNIKYSSKINDIILGIKENNVIKTVDKGYAKNVEDFFNQMIKWQFADKEMIKFIHNSLLEYVKRSDVVFPIRLYGSAGKDKYYLLRRGFLSMYKNGMKTFFCDNTFAMPFAAMKLYNKTYTASDLIEHLSQKNVVCSFGSTSEEKELSYYSCESCNRINLNTSGWYLAHIVPVGYDFVGKQRLSRVFENPDRTEWKSNVEHVRHIGRLPDENEYSILVAHFLRLVHPLNSFIIPKNKLVAYAGKRLGEEQELINIVQDYIKTEFPKEYTELREIMQIPEQNEVVTNIGEIYWSMSGYEVSKRRKTIKQIAPLVISRVRSKVEDEYDEDKEFALENTLNSVGKAAFLNLYPLVRDNIEIDASEIEKKYPQYKKSVQTRLSSTRSIIRNGLETEALEIIAGSSRMSETERQTARMFLEELAK